MATSYYKKIKGKNYDRELLDLAESSVSGKGDGRISIEDAKMLLEGVKDADAYTDVEKRTIKYIRDHYKFTSGADKWFRTEIRSWAAKRSAKSKTSSKIKTKKTRKKKTSVSMQSPKSSTVQKNEENDLAAAYQIAQVSDNLQIDNEKSSRKRIFIFSILLLAILFLLLYLSCPHIKSCSSTQVSNSQNKQIQLEVKDDTDAKVNAKTKVKTEAEVEKVSETKQVALTNFSSKDVEKTVLKFYYSSSKLSKQTKKALMPIIAFLKNNKNKKLKIIGHTCSLGKASVNKKFSLKRAKRAAKFISSHGISQNRLITIGMGESKPLNKTKSKYARRQNRRVQFIVK